MNRAIAYQRTPTRHFNNRPRVAQATRSSDDGGEHDSRDGRADQHREIQRT